MQNQVLLITAAVVLSAAAAFAAQTESFRIHADGVDRLVASQVHADLVRAEQRIEGMFGAFPDTVGVWVHGSRADFDSAVREAWGLPGTECWMVGGADGHALHLLSPGVWGDAACEHDAMDAGHVRGIVTHELAHAYHMQVNPAADTGLLEDIAWFAEGFATYAAGQLDHRLAGRASDAIAAGETPARLAGSWSGRYRYGVAGSMVAFIDARWGRSTVRHLLTAVSHDEIFAALGIPEAEFLELWAAWARETGA